MLAPWPKAGVLGAYRPSITSPIPSATCGAACWFRDAVVRTRTRYISVIRALICQQGYRVPSDSAENFTRRAADTRKDLP
jgi:transposase